MVALLDPSSVDKAIKIVSNLDSSLSGVELKTCSDMYDNLLEGDLGGSKGKSAAESYRKKCAAVFKYATKFRDPLSSPAKPAKKCPSTNDIEEHSSSPNSVASGGGAGDAKHVVITNSTKNMHKNNCKQNEKTVKQVNSVATAAKVEQ